MTPKDVLHASMAAYLERQHPGTRWTFRKSSAALDASVRRALAAGLTPEEIVEAKREAGTYTPEEIARAFERVGVGGVSG